MNFRWLWLDHFPPGMELTEAQRAEARERARKHRLRDQSYRGSAKAAGRLAGIMAGILSLAFCFWIYMLVGMRLRTAVQMPVQVFGTLLFQGLLWLSISLAMNRSRVPYIRKALNDM